ncbi:SusC/RagA family TonB-linked outer membrane protein [Flavobacterium reichenbachii]|uniref:SusC/RagA family TonB-linked outer membrane protein n=1 Tax=Flavobacterium reichenbachii TaxID=362418 RepID=UPI001F0A405A|nr:TonB-dependent receptor [Flavobacterium reichenbachii]
MKIKTTWKTSSSHLSSFTWSKLKFSTNGLICLLFLMFCAESSYAQNDNSVKITGNVIDTKGLSLPSATVLEKGTKNAVTTDFDGTFTITVSSPQAILVFKFIGMKAVERSLNNNKNITVTMQEETSDLQAVVVVGYGTQKKASVVGAISTIKPSLLQVGTSRTLSNNLAGQITGVMAVQRSGEPGYDQSDIKIRGISTFKGGTNPLVLVDGIERNLNDLDPSEIESFSVLKDAAASAVYGVRGANGVILINTKRGFVGAPRIQVRTEYSIQEPTKLPEFIGAAPYMTLLNQLAAEQGRPQLYTEDRITKTASRYDPDLYPDVNWVDAITKDYAFTSRSNLNVAGGSEILRYALTASYYSENGIMSADPKQTYDSETRLNRANVRTNVDVNVSKTTLLRVNIGGFLQNLNKGNSSTDDLFNKAFETTPFVHPAVYSDGTIPRVFARENPWAMSTQQGYYKQGGSKIESLVSLEQDLKGITPGLKAKFTYSFDSYSENKVIRGKSPDYYNVATQRDLDGSLIHGTVQAYGQEYLGYKTEASFGNRRIYLEANTTYNRTFGKHDLSGLFLYNQDSYQDDRPPQAFKHQGIAGRTSYTFDRKYIGEFNFGYNGSENFAKGNRYGFFPSVAMGWIASEEKFMEPFKDVFNKIKFRGSYGLVGNDNIGANRRFAYLTTISDNNNSDYTFGTGNGVKFEGIEEGEIGVSNLTWEKVAKLDFGVELGLWNMLDLTVDIFQEKRKDIFISRNTVPTQAGFINAPWANYGKMENKGIEVAFNLNKQVTPDFFMSWRANFTFVENKVTERDEPDAVKGTYRSATGIQNNTLWGYTATGLYTNEDFTSPGVLAPGLPVPTFGTSLRPGDIKYQDRNNDGIISGLDEGFIGGTTDPQIIYGFGTNLKYKQFDLSFFFQGVAKSERIIGGSNFIPGSGTGTLGNIYSNYEDRWTEQNQSQDVFYPRLSYGPNLNNSVASTWWKKDMSFGRLKTMEVGYSFDKKLLEKLYLQGLRIYVSGNNLWYASKFKLWDPELDTGNGLRYPSTRSVLFGLSIGL